MQQYCSVRYCMWTCTIWTFGRFVCLVLHLQHVGTWQRKMKSWIRRAHLPITSTTPHSTRCQCRPARWDGTMSTWPSTMTSASRSWHRTSMCTIQVGTVVILWVCDCPFLPLSLLWWPSGIAYTPWEPEIGDCSLLSLVRSYQVGCCDDDVAVWLYFPSSLTAVMAKCFCVHLVSRR